MNHRSDLQWPIVAILSTFIGWSIAGISGCGVAVHEGGGAHQLSSSVKDKRRPEGFTNSGKAGGRSQKTDLAEQGRVPVALYLMSKCPYGTQLLKEIAPVLWGLKDCIELHVEYIGSIGEYEELQSMHGEAEVAGDILQICARETGGVEAQLDFMLCLNDDWQKIPEGWQRCADEIGIAAEALRKCYEGTNGARLLAASFRRSLTRRATGSPTVFVGGQPYAGGRSADALARRLCDMIQSPVPEYCQTVPMPIEIEVVLLSDNRCRDERGCDPARFAGFVSSVFEGASVKRLDFSSVEGRELFALSGMQHLPIAVFGSEVVYEREPYTRLEGRMVKMGDGRFAYPLGRIWDPLAEVCYDEMDNTGNGKVDCADDTCADKIACRPKQDKRLDLFVMSQCPHAARTIVAMKEVLELFNKRRQQIDFELIFIGQVGPDGELLSMHGGDELKENLRQICVQKIYKQRYEFMDYVACRSKDLRNMDWKSCLTEVMDPKKISRCASGKQGKRLLKASFEKSNVLGITGSPSWLLNNTKTIGARTAHSIVKVFCSENAEVSGCESISKGMASEPEHDHMGCEFN